MDRAGQRGKEGITRRGEGKVRNKRAGEEMADISLLLPSSPPLLPPYPPVLSL